MRYDNGYASYLDVLDAQRNSFQAELGLVSAKLDQLNAVVDLYKALGGGWETPAKS
ncbi:TolC family protein [Chromobacterium haemolyticum]|uniref:TolC family protein n=1 Tax=Chromobacterium haemolyticum TaxID=394935 RepID=UPI0021183692|nr:TolC family protein [Chromobacterium haemolyticum]